MKCVIEGRNVKVFGRAIHALSRVSDEIWLDPSDKGLAVRSVSSAQCAYACFLFTPLFFQLYQCSAVPLQHVTGKFKLPVKALLPLFRCLSTIDRSVDSCSISTGTPDNRVVFQLSCKHGITKTYSLGFQDCETLQAVFPAHLCPNILKAKASLLSDIVIHFPPSLEEVSLSLCPSRVNLRNYDEEDDRVKAMTTEVSLHPEEFDYVHVGVDSEITFCLKELRDPNACEGLEPYRVHLNPDQRKEHITVVCSVGTEGDVLMGLLSFADSHGLPICVHFGCPGQPVCFTVENMVVEVSMVLATLTDPEGSPHSQTAAGCQALDQPSNEGREPLRHSCLLGGPTDVEPALFQAPEEENIPSSQGSPTFSGPLHLRQILRMEAVTSASADASHMRKHTGQATPRVCSLLFGAVSGLGEEGVALHRGLAYASDTEEDTVEQEEAPPMHNGTGTDTLHPAAITQAAPSVVDMCESS